MKQEIIKKLVERVTDYGYNDEYGYYSDWADGVEPIISKYFNEYNDNLIKEIEKIKTKFSDEEYRNGDYVVESIIELLK